MSELDGKAYLASLNERLAFWEQLRQLPDQLFGCSFRLHRDRYPAEMRFDYVRVFHISPDQIRIHILFLTEVERLADGMNLKDAMSSSCQVAGKLGVAPSCQVNERRHAGNMASNGQRAEVTL